MKTSHGAAGDDSSSHIHGHIDKQTASKDSRRTFVTVSCMAIIIAAVICAIATASIHAAAALNSSQTQGAQGDPSPKFAQLALKASANSASEQESEDSSSDGEVGNEGAGDEGKAATSASDDSSQNAAATPDPTDPRLVESASKNMTKPKEHAVYLTFDDGPSDLTPSILETLEKNGVTATWFVSGSNSNLDMLQKIWDAGHQVAIHTNSHNYRKIYKSKDAFFKDMEKIAKKIEKRIGVSPKLIRFPGGSINSYNKKTYKKIIKELNERHWHYFDWNASIEDAVTIKPKSSKTLLRNAKRESKGLHSICLLMHDTNAKKTTAKALDGIIKYYKKHGYEFKYLTANSYGYHFQAN